MSLYQYQGVRYALVCIGVGGGTGARFATRDATAIYQLLRSGVGPLDDEHGGYLLLGPGATSDSLDTVLASLARQRPDVVVFFFAGHANELGFALHDGLYIYRDLAVRLERTRAARTLVVLDGCKSGAYAQLLEKAPRVGGLGGVSDPAWNIAILASGTGARVITATDRTRTTGEGHVLTSHGDLTAALLIAADDARPNIHVGGELFIGDGAWFARAKGVLAEHHIDHGARRIGGGSDFPIVRSERARPVGIVEILGARVNNNVITVDVRAHDRQRLDTRVGTTVLSTLNGAMTSFEAIWRPETRAFSETIACDLGGAFDDAEHHAWGAYGFEVNVAVHVTDRFGRTLAHRVLGLGASYR